MGHRVAATITALSSAVGLSACSPEAAQPAEVERLVPEIIATHPFDDTSFTQGLEVEESGTLLVGTGWHGESRLYRSTMAGEELNSVDLEPEFFGEGITRHDDHIWQLTWQAGIAVKRDAETLAELDRTSYPGEGWGLCSTGSELIMSDGTSQLRRLDPDTFAELGRVEVTLDGKEQSGLNELECVDGDVYANVFLSTDILRIDAAGTVTALIDASALPNNAEPDPNHVLNGIAHLPGTDRFLLAGKRWPDLYEVELVPAE
ncbi:MAG: glutaminyl-peptide cyclotransferase [Corynebacterium sp.]|uniref:glutaminyl-peptide cyclotransferase n=1 Tax=Corynebacterium sp. TaxID=1720 RepID=UPI0026E0BC43|nr:glutaminyl-peptide cyclotransferase [Corynebacterium sp.]MDO5671071.1 glutaminyl-peptide cyclotransferase [Corynebacterium sp.]